MKPNLPYNRPEQPLDDDALDARMRAAFDDFEPEVSPQVWENIARRARKRNPWPGRLAAAAGVALLALAGLWLANPDQTTEPRASDMIADSAVSGQSPPAAVPQNTPLPEEKEFFPAKTDARTDEVRADGARPLASHIDERQIAATLKTETAERPARQSIAREPFHEKPQRAEQDIPKPALAFVKPVELRGNEALGAQSTRTLPTSRPEFIQPARLRPAFANLDQETPSENRTGQPKQTSLAAFLLKRAPGVKINETVAEESGARKVQYSFGGFVQYRKTVLSE